MYEKYFWYRAKLNNSMENYADDLRFLPDVYATVFQILVGLCFGLGKWKTWRCGVNQAFQTIEEDARKAWVTTREGIAWPIFCTAAYRSSLNL